MLISVHTPKTGGNSFEEFLKNHFGHYYREDYDDNPLYSGHFETHKQNAILFDRELNLHKRNLMRHHQIQCIHGHHMPYKYKNFLLDEGTKFTIWLR